MQCCISWHFFLYLPVSAPFLLGYIYIFRFICWPASFTASSELLRILRFWRSSPRWALATWAPGRRERRCMLIGLCTSVLSRWSRWSQVLVMGGDFFLKDDDTSGKNDGETNAPSETFGRSWDIIILHYSWWFFGGALLEERFFLLFECFWECDHFGIIWAAHVEDESNIMMSGMHHQWRQQGTPKARDVEVLWNAVNIVKLYVWISQLVAASYCTRYICCRKFWLITITDMLHGWKSFRVAKCCFAICTSRDPVQTQNDWLPKIQNG